MVSQSQSELSSRLFYLQQIGKVSPNYWMLQVKRMASIIIAIHSIHLDQVP